MDKIKETLEKKEIADTIRSMEMEGDAGMSPEDYAEDEIAKVELISNDVVSEMGKDVKGDGLETSGGKKETAAEMYKRTAAKTFRGNRKTITISTERDDERKLNAFKQTAADLMGSYSKKIPVEVTIDGIEPVMMGNAGTEMVPVANVNGWKVMIPIREFLTKDEAERETMRIRLFGTPGATVDVIPYSPGKGPDGKKINPFMKMNGQYVVIASRLRAMEIKKRQFWFGVNESGNDYVFKEGLRVESRVVFVMRNFIIVEAFGVETKIEARDISYNRISDCQEMFSVGEKVMVRITDVKRDENTGRVEFSASVKDAYRDPRVDAFRKYVRGGVYKGVIAYMPTNATEDPNPYCLVRLDGIDVYCPYPDKLGLKLGDKADVAITYKNEDSLRIFGRVKHYD